MSDETEVEAKEEPIILDIQDFDPKPFITRVNGSPYLEVKWRLVWLRKKHPNARIETKCLQAEDNLARFVCLIEIPDTGAMATGHGSETSNDFRDFYEKAETKAIGRALANIGFGTQFAPDLDFGAAKGRVVDSPVKPPQRQQRPAQAPQRAPTPIRKDHPQRGDPVEQRAREELCTQSQQITLRKAGQARGLEVPDIEEMSQEHYGTNVVNLTKRECSELIDRINAIPM